MNIQEFADRYASENHVPAEDICDRWEKEKQVHDFLGLEVSTGVVVADLLHGDGMLDQISPELREGFQELMGEKADSYHEIHQIILEKLERGDRSVLGLVNKIKGQIGENFFQEQCNAADIHAQLAPLGNQPGWDLSVANTDGTTEYIQVKMYSNAGGVLKHMEKVQAKLDAGEITGLNGEVVTDIDFAVSSNIADEVSAKAQELGLDIDVIPVEMTADEAANVVQDGVDNLGPDALENFFGELFGAAVTTTALHAMVNGFLLYKGAKSSEEFWEDTITSSAVSLGGLTAGMGVEAALNQFAILGGPPTYALVFATAFSTRAILKRLVGRGDAVEWANGSNKQLAALTESVQAA